MTMNLPKLSQARENRQKIAKTDRVPTRIKDAAKKHGWAVHPVTSFWTRLKKDDISIEFNYNLRRETRGRAYRNDVVLIRIFYNQREILEFMEAI